MIYLDWASTSPPDPDLLAESVRIASEHYGNPSSPHGLGQAARTKLEEARKAMLALLGKGAEAGRLVFTGSGSEADAIPLLSLLRKSSKDGSLPHIVLSEIEHAAIHEEAAILRRFGVTVSMVRPDRKSTRLNSSH